jgi:hypothetical protein
MSTSSWPADALLGSPIPPPNWLDPRNRGTGWVAPGGWFTSSYRVPAEKIAFELDEIKSCVNPPVIQGWAWCLAIAGLVSMLLGAKTLMGYRTMELPAIVLFLAPIPVWFVAVTAGAFVSHDVELRDGVVYVRRWSDVWFGLAGKRVGPREDIHAVLSCGSHLHLASDARVVVVSMAMWPSSSRSALEERFDNWGIELEFPGRHHVHHPAHWNHGRHRVAHRMPDRRRSD